jgi:DNA topoisomerase-1
MSNTRTRTGSTVGPPAYFGAMARRGWRRLGRKRFRYVDAHDVAITDEEQLEPIEALVFPPAWTGVWISPNPRARLQATGVDTAGRKQYRYHESYRAARDRAKFERLLDFAKGLPRFRGRTDPASSARSARARVGLRARRRCHQQGVVRVGSEQHARSSRTDGVTTLRKRHVTVDGDEMHSASARRTASSCGGRS